MSDDIVTRLREEAANRRGHWDTLLAAADEIERLRKKANVWRGICERFAESDPRFDAFLCYFKAVRDE